MIFIARNRDGKPISIISCEKENSARAYWQGQGLNFNTIESFDIDEDRENEKMGYVTPLLKTEEKKFNLAFGKEIEVLIVE